MDHLGGLFEGAGEGAPAVEAHGQHSSMRSVQNLEAVINEGLRVALMEETPDQSLEVLLEYIRVGEYGGGTGKGEPSKCPFGGMCKLVSEFQNRQAYRY